MRARTVGCYLARPGIATFFLCIDRAAPQQGEVRRRYLTLRLIWMGLQQVDVLAMLKRKKTKEKEIHSLKVLNLSDPSCHEWLAFGHGHGRIHLLAVAATSSMQAISCVGGKISRDRPRFRGFAVEQLFYVSSMSVGTLRAHYDATSIQRV